MGICDFYHFHKDCKYYEQCKEETVFKGKRKYTKFICPRLKHPQLYYPKDLHTIKWDCPLFEPKQRDIKEVIKQKIKAGMRKGGESHCTN